MTTVPTPEQREQVEQELQAGADAEERRCRENEGPTDADMQVVHERLERTWRVHATFFTAGVDEHAQTSPVRPHAEHLGPQRGPSRARRSKPGRRRSATARSGSEPPDGEGEGDLARRIAAYAAEQQARLDEVIVELAEAEAEIRRLRGEG